MQRPLEEDFGRGRKGQYADPCVKCTENSGQSRFPLYPHQGSVNPLVSLCSVTWEFVQCALVHPEKPHTHLGDFREPPPKPYEHSQPCSHGSKSRTSSVGSKMGGAPTPKWDLIGFDPQPCKCLWNPKDHTRVIIKIRY